jgi:undecaprenyl-diphosphatase
MALWLAALLGVLQGLTEFLPVSSSGHLALAQMLVPGFSQPGVVFDAMLHVGTACAVVWYERQNLVRWVSNPQGRRLLALIVAGTAATAVVAFPVRELAIAAFLRPVWVGVALVVTGLVVAGTGRLAGGDIDESGTSWRQVVAVGLAQGLAVFPGLSRSGVTIAAGLGSGMDRTWAARFSFLLAVPAITMATIFELAGTWRVPYRPPNGFGLACLVGALCAAVTGYFALKLVIRAVSSKIFHRFAWYCIPLGLVVILWGLWP